MRRRSSTGLVLGLLLIFFASGCGQTARPLNVLILSIDTLRADHLGCYGYRRNTSPHLDRFAARSIRYANAIAAAPWTLPSHVALLSGRHPYEIGIRDHESSIPTGVELLAESLQRAGYQTAAFVDSPPAGYVGGQRGFDRGFDSYSHAPHSTGSDYRYDMAATVDVAARWLDERDPVQPFFLFLHTKSVHGTPSTPALLADSDAPYHTPEPYRTRFLGREPRYSWTDEDGAAGVQYLRALNQDIASGIFERSRFPDEKLEELVALYDGGIYYVDEQVARLLAVLDELGLAQDTLIVVTADHGEAFLEHDLFLHQEVYRPLLHVPLLVHDPRQKGVEGRVVTTPVALADVAPTVLTRVGLPIPAATTARPLPVTVAEETARRAFFSVFEYEDGYFYRASALQYGPWKLVSHRLGREGEPVAELFNVATDRFERHPLSDQSERQEAMLAELLGRLEALPAATGERIELDGATLEHLQALGYLE